MNTTYEHDIANAHDDTGMTKNQMDEALRDMALHGAMRDASEGIRRDPSMLTKELVEAVLYAQAMNKMANEAEYALQEPDYVLEDRACRGGCTIEDDEAFTARMDALERASMDRYEAQLESNASRGQLGY